jgi:hypothetical protein
LAFSGFVKHDVGIPYLNEAMTDTYQNTPTPETSDQIEETELLNTQKELF